MDEWMFGEWAEAARIFNGFHVKLKRAATGGLRKEAELTAARLRANIIGQAYQHTPLADSTVRQKGHDQTLIEKLDMVNAIEAVDMGHSRFGVGVRDETQAAKLAAHEFGTTRVPERPTLRVELERIRSSGLRNVNAAMAKVLRGY